MKKILLASIILTAVFAQRSMVSSVYADATYTVGTDKEYATIQDAKKAITNDLSGDLSGQGVQTIEVYAGGSHEGNGYFYDGSPSISGFSNASSNDYIVLKAMVPNQGKRDTGIIIRRAAGTSTCCSLNTPYTRMIGFGITLDGTNNGSTACIYSSKSGVQIIGNVMYNMKTTSLYVNLIHLDDSTNSIIRNNMIMDYGSSDATHDINSAGIDLRRVTNTKVYNNTLVNSSDGTYAANAFWWTDLGTGNVLKNNYAGNNLVSFKRRPGTGGPDPGVTYCISSDATADNWEGDGNQINKAAANQFNNATAGEEDLRLIKGADCINAGFDLSGQGFTDDIDGTPRGYGGAWDVGADELWEGTIFVGY